MIKSLLERLLFHPGAGGGSGMGTNGTGEGDPPADDKAGAGGGKTKDDNNGAGEPTDKPGAGDGGGKGKDDKKGLVPVAEVAQERKKRQALESQIVELKKKDEEFRKNLLAALDPNAADDSDPAEIARVANERAASLEARAKSALLRSALTAAAAREGATDPADIFLILSGKDGIEVDLDTGEVKGAAEAVAELKKNKAYLFKGPAASPPGGGTPPGSDPDPNAPKNADLEDLKKRAAAGDDIARTQLMKRVKELKK